jgi:hypothetical protein
MMEVNALAVLVAAASSFLLGGAWYSKALFGEAWKREAGVQEEKKGHPSAVFIASFLFALAGAAIFALWLGPNPPLPKALAQALLAGGGFVATSFGINYQFAQRGMRMWAIDAGYHLVQFLLFGLVLGLWHR